MLWKYRNSLVQKKYAAQKIFTLYAKGGSMAYRSIEPRLLALSEVDPEMGAATLKTLERRGY
ncbi:hypothetical protein COPG_00086 [Colwellia phage 9A]|uniref:Uncharacterized protein n=1 Tax=Colwellia phage 9A TaxID=765765 RepID=I3UMG7_9CAUD|nr:hypothetical protein COPG_00086 [Colwellia phage 9A]AFK66682.1 hypothetical protein COPG_00086 [Colwellia phage 9A]